MLHILLRKCKLTMCTRMSTSSGRAANTDSYTTAQTKQRPEWKLEKDVLFSLVINLPVTIYSTQWEA